MCYCFVLLLLLLLFFVVFCCCFLKIVFVVFLVVVLGFCLENLPHRTEVWDYKGHPWLRPNMSVSYFYFNVLKYK